MCMLLLGGVFCMWLWDIVGLLSSVFASVLVVLPIIASGVLKSPAVIVELLLPLEILSVCASYILMVCHWVQVFGIRSWYIELFTSILCFSLSRNSFWFKIYFASSQCSQPLLSFAYCLHRVSFSIRSLWSCLRLCISSESLVGKL